MVRSGYEFFGWNTLANGTGTDRAAGKLFTMPTTNLTLHAQWLINTYTITYNLGGTNDAGNPATYTVADGTITMGDPVRGTYVFGGWYDNGAYTGSPVSEIVTGSTGDVVLNAKWTAMATVSYNGNTATGGAAPAKQTKTFNVPLALSGNTNPTTYTINSPTITLAAHAAMANQNSIGWVTATNYGDSLWYYMQSNLVTTIPAESTGDKTFYAWYEPVPMVTRALFLNSGGTSNKTNVGDTIEVTLSAPLDASAVHPGLVRGDMTTGTDIGTYFVFWGAADTRMEYPNFHNPGYLETHAGFRIVNTNGTTW